LSDEDDDGSMPTGKVLLQCIGVLAGVLFLGYVLVLVGAWAIGGGW
jgi:hypothetical protein